MTTIVRKTNSTHPSQAIQRFGLNDDDLASIDINVNVIASSDPEIRQLHIFKHYR
ncbi:hypothetical protein ACU40P_00295 [Staphylococcus arlettae]|uniref:hypothetical protein n=1 Tax=Staphylococcus TaxID=1279 RepID=UPI00113F59FB|nr:MULTISPECIES: hypothetical protein [Staphylococcus]MCD9054132.1 hypothetical protein [Staphylococcus arlettae]BBK28638.1 hypothetical protein SAP2_18220 [Staphylococcus arlettae]